MRRIHHKRVERKLLSVDQHIREAEERRARGEPVSEAEIKQLQAVKREAVNHESLQADNKDYIDNRNSRRAQRNKFQKFIDTVTCER